MGPEATLELFRRIIEQTPAHKTEITSGSLLIATPRYLIELKLSCMVVRIPFPS